MDEIKNVGKSLSSRIQIRILIARMIIAIAVYAAFDTGNIYYNSCDSSVMKVNHSLSFAVLQTHGLKFISDSRHELYVN